MLTTSEYIIAEIAILIRETERNLEFRFGGLLPQVPAAEGTAEPDTPKPASEVTADPATEPAPV